MQQDAWLYKKVFDAVTEMIFVADVTTGLILDCNQAAVDTLGWSREEIVGKHQRFLHPEVEQDGEFTTSFRASLEDRDGETINSHMVARDGTVLDVNIKAGTFEHQGRKLILGVFHNVTERRRYERRIWDLSRFPEENPNPVLRAGADGKILFANEVSCSVLHEGGCRLGDTMPPHFKAAITLALSTNDLQVLEVQQGRRFFHYTLAPVKDAGYVNIYGMDITARKQTEQALAVSEERYRLALKAANFGSWDADLISGKVSWSETTESLFGKSPGEMGGTYKDFIALVHEDDRERIQQAVNAALEKDQDYDVEYRILYPDGTVRWMRGTGAVYRDDSGAPVRMSGIVQDITEQKEARSRIEYLALHDSLTGLYNREAFLDHLDKALSRAKRSGTRLALLFLDLDGFKGVNDSLGHLAGDNVLKEVAQRIHGSIRDMDMAARLGGDEFALLLPDLEDMSYAETVAKRILESVKRPLCFDERTCTLSVSIGIAVSPDHASDVKSLLKCSDEAMYQVKNSGRNGFAMCAAKADSTTR